MVIIYKKKTETALAPVSVLVEKDNQSENHNKVMRFLRIPIIKILNALPERMSKTLFVTFSGPDGDPRIVASTATTYAALENMYTFQERKAMGKTKLMDRIWQSLANAKAIRNRLLLTEKKLLEAITDICQKKDTINLLSLGSGSARAVIEVLSKFNGQPKVKCMLIDLSGNALKYAQELAQMFNVDLPKECCHKDWADNLNNYCKNFQPDIVETVGLIDYYPHEEAIKLVAEIYKSLAPDGWLIACNICPNLEEPFVTKGIGWGKMNYRTPEQLAQIMCQGGFAIKDIQLVFEPERIHLLVIARKPKST